MQTANGTISEKDASTISENLSINISPNFDKIIVEPFLLSLVCQKIYPELTNPTVPKTEEEKEAWIKELVYNAIEKHIDDIYSVIGDKTKEFIEDKLITTDNKRTLFSYDDACKYTGFTEIDKVLRKDIGELITNPAYRLLNDEPYLGVKHIQILHDRLVPPISQKRDERKKLLEITTLKQKEEKLELEAKQAKEKLEEEARQNAIRLTKEAEAERLRLELVQKVELENLKLEQANAHRRQERKIVITIASIIILAFAGLATILAVAKDRVQNKNKVLTQLTAELNKKSDSIQRWSKYEQTTNDSLVSAEGKAKVLANNLISSINYLENSYQEVSDQKRSLYRLSEQLEHTNKQLMIKSDSLKRSNRSGEIANFFTTQSGALIMGLQKSSPFVALAMARSTLREIDSIFRKTDDTAIIRDYQKGLLEVYNKTSFFKQCDLFVSSYSGTSLNGKYSTNLSMLAENKIWPDKNVFVIYNLADSSRRDTIDNFIRHRAANAGPGANYNKVISSGFSGDNRFFWTLEETDGHTAVLNLWSVADPGKAQFFKQIEISQTLLSNKSGYHNLTARSKGNHVFIYAETAKTFEIEVCDLASGTGLKYSVKKNVKTVNRILDFGFTDHKPCVIMADYLSYKLLRLPEESQPVLLVGGGMHFTNDSTVCAMATNNEIIFWHGSSKKSDTVMAPYMGRIVDPVLIGENKIIGFDPYSYSIQVWVKQGNAWYLKLLQPTGFYYKASYLSPDQKYAAYVCSKEMFMLDVAADKIIDSLAFSPVQGFSFDGSGRVATFLSGDNIYKWFFIKPPSISTPHDLENLLSSGYYGNPWISDVDLKKYGVRDN